MAAVKRKKVALALLVVFALPFVFAEQSQLELLLTEDDRLVVSHVYDDDKSIELLEVFLVAEGFGKRYRFGNVIEGTVLPVDPNLYEYEPNAPYEVEQEILETAKKKYPESGLPANLAGEGNGGSPQRPLLRSVYYNFADTDGTLTNSKFFIYLTRPDFLPSEAPQPEYVPLPLSSKSLSARKDTASDNYYIDVKIAGSEIERAVFYYSFLEGSGYGQQLELSLSENGSFAGTLGPFNGKVSLRSLVNIFTARDSFEYFFDKKVFGVVSRNAAGSCGEGSFSQKMTTPVSVRGASFAVSFKFSGIWITEDLGFTGGLGEKGFKVIRLIDDDQDVDFVEFVVETGGQTTSYSFEGVTLGQTLSFAVPENSFVYYNFSDFDGSWSNINYYFPVAKEDVIELSFFAIDQEAEVLEEAQLQVVPSDDCSSFKIRVLAKTNPSAASAYLRYGFEESSMPFFVELAENTAGLYEQPEEQKALLQETGLLFEGEVGPFENGTEFYANVYAQTEGGLIDKMLGFGQWVGLTKQELAETCGNFLDDDNDGQTDEGCILLPDLFFLSHDIPDFFVGDQPSQFSVQVKNAGVVTAQAFDVGLYLDETLVEAKPVTSLGAGKETTVSFGFSLSQGGTADLKVVVDPTNNVAELNELNNDVSKEVFIGKNFFNLVLNFNEANFVGDTRTIRVFDRLGKPISGALITLSLPSGRAAELFSDSSGYASFVLDETGVYLVNAAKSDFDTFEGAFSVPKIIVLGIKPNYALGEQLSIAVETEKGQLLTDFVVVITTPSNETNTITYNEKFYLGSSGRYSLAVLRNNVTIFSSTINVLGFLESVSFAGGLIDQLFGGMLDEPPLFFFLLLFSFFAAWVFYSKKAFASLKPKTTNQMRLEFVLRSAVCVLLFLLPFQISRFFGFNAGILMAIAEILAVLALDFFINKGKKAVLKESDFV